MTGKLSKVNLASLAADVAAFDKLEQVIHVKGRLAIISVLAATQSLPFTELRDVLGQTEAIWRRTCGRLTRLATCV